MTFNLPAQSDALKDFIDKNTKRYLVIIKKPESLRSVVQNRYYWFMLTLIQDDTGNDKDDLHVYFGERFRRKTKEINGEMVEFTQSTTKLTTLETEDYYTKIRVFASQEFGIFVPLPNESAHNYLIL